MDTNSYQETALCLDSFFWLKFEASTVNLYNYYPLLVPECRCQALLFLTDIFAVPRDYSTRGISRLKCTVESDLIYRFNDRIIFWDLTNQSAENFRCLISPAQRSNEHAAYMLFGRCALETCSGGTERIAVIKELTKQLVLCKSIRPDFTLTFR